MKLVFCQLFLFLFIIKSSVQSHDTSDLPADIKKIYHKLHNATRRTLTSIIPPICYEIIENNATQAEYISAKGLNGRITPVGTFTNFPLALEYLYAIICPIPYLPARLFTVTSFDLVHIGYDTKYYITESNYILNLTGGARLTFYESMAFDKDFLLCGYDGQIRNLGLTLDTHTQAEHTYFIQHVCNATQRFCTGSLQQYDSYDDCIDFLTNDIPYGSYDQADQGNVCCRNIHTLLLPLRPDLHCPHVGPTGGDACYNKTVDYYYEQQNFMGCAHKYADDDD